MHGLLRRQLRHHGIDLPPGDTRCEAFLQAVSSAYEAFDEDRVTLERSLELSSQELLEANRELRTNSELLRATLESTADGILAVDAEGRVIYANARFAEIWCIPEELVSSGDDQRLLNYVLDQLVDPEQFLSRVRELYGSSAESFDVLHFKDGRVLDRFSRPLIDAGRLAGRVWNFRDVTERRRAESALRESEERFRALVQNSSDMMVILDGTARVTYVSPAVSRLMGYRERDLLGRGVLSLVHPDDLASEAESLRAVLAEPGAHPPKEVRLRHADGRWRDIELVATNLLAEPAVRGVVFNARDVTERTAAERSLRASEERLRRMAATTPVGIYQTDGAGKVTYLNDAARRMFEIADEEDINQYRYEDFYPPEALELMRQSHEDGGPLTFEVEMMGARGTRRDVMITGTPLVDDGNHSMGMIGTIVDITDRKQHERLLAHSASHDPLTDALNRRSFEHAVRSQIAEDCANGTTSCVLFVDLDDFKAVNDSFGHPVGDRLLIQLTHLLRNHLRERDVLARLGGDEFGILMPGVDVRQARAIARRLLRTLAEHPIDVEGRLVDMLCSVGVAMIPAHGATVDELLARADMAMYAAKDLGRNRVCVYSPRRGHGDPAERLKWKHRIREALDSDGLTLYAQPIVDLATGKVDRYELLLRMTDENGKTVLPGAFLGLAEAYGLIAEIDAWVVQQAVNVLRSDAGRGLRIAVNLSGRALDDRSLLRLIKRELSDPSLDPRNICFELTESAAILEMDKAQRLICSVTDLGCQFALDDFGVGFSSFSRLKHLPIDELKIDGSFIRNLRDSAVDQHLVRSIVELARGLNMRVVAEFVQDALSAELLREYGVQFGQGFYLGRPVPLSDVLGRGRLAA